MSKKARVATKFPLLVYRRLARMWFWPSAPLFVLTAVLIVWNPPLLSELRWWFLPVTLIAAGVMVYALLARYTTYVQAHPHSLRVKAPFYRLSVSYGRLNIVRTVSFKTHFPPESLSWTQRQLAEKLYGHSCIVVELKGYPLSRGWLAILLNRFLLPDKTTGLTLLVKDWMQLSNEIEGARAEWVNRRLLKRRAQSDERTVEKILCK